MWGGGFENWMADEKEWARTKDKAWEALTAILSNPKAVPSLDVSKETLVTIAFEFAAEFEEHYQHLRRLGEDDDR